jgi:hypothetical protein
MKNTQPTKSVKKPSKTRSNQAKSQEKLPYRDFDTPWKDATKAFFREFLTLTLPKLAADVDWLCPPEFLEQELVNLLKGRLKIKDKIHKTDRLVKLYLLSGQEQFLFLHAEHQHNPQNIFPRRMYIYRSLIALKHDTDNIVPIAVFTGAPPAIDSLIYKHELYGGKISYEFNVYIIAYQSEEELLKSDNPFALIVLAALYAYRSGEDKLQKFTFMRKLFELAFQKQISMEIIQQILIFVSDLMNVDYEEFRQTINENILFHEEKSETMIMTADKLYVMDRMTALVNNGKGLIQLLEEDIEAKMRPKLEAKIASEKEAEKEAEKEIERQKIILNLHLNAKMSAEDIAKFLELPQDKVEKIVATQSDSKEEVISS